MPFTGFRIASVVLLAGAALVAPAPAGGPLDPPAGVPAGTNRVMLNSQWTTLPYTIASPGSYVLTSSLVAPAGYTGSGIIVSANDVTIDLNGFALIGAAGAPLTAHGIAANSAPLKENFTVRNGSIRGWGGDGISALQTHGVIVEDIRASDNGEDGIVVGTSAVVRDCVVADNADVGITAGDASMIRACAASGNTWGIGTLGRTTVADSVSNDNDLEGFIIGGGSTISRCTAHDNGRASVANDGVAAISAAFGSTLVDCTAYDNQCIGFFAVDGCTVSRCTAKLNDRHGFLVTSDCHVSGSTADQNGVEPGSAWAGFKITGSRNRIDSNAATQNDAGFAVDAAGANLVIRNWAYSNGAGGCDDYVTAAGNLIANVFIDPDTSNVNANLGGGCIP
jgi:hypothetical protein